MKKIFLFIISLITLLTSCNKEDYREQFVGKYQVELSTYSIAAHSDSSGLSADYDTIIENLVMNVTLNPNLENQIYITEEGEDISGLDNCINSENCPFIDLSGNITIDYAYYTPILGVNGSIKNNTLSYEVNKSWKTLKVKTLYKGNKIN